MRTLTLLLIAAALTASAFVADEAKPDGKALFDKNCASCHAQDGKGNEKIAKIQKLDMAALDLTGKAVKDKSDADLTKIIAEGKDKMPGYKNSYKTKTVLTDEEIAAVLKHMRSLAEPKKDEAKK